jgi:hypothetical protein
LEAIFIYECGIRDSFSGRIFSLFIRIHTLNIHPFRRLRLMIFLRFSRPDRIHTEGPIRSLHHSQISKHL